MIRAVLVAAVAGFSWPYFVDVSIPGIPPRHIITPLTEIDFSARPDSNDTTFARQMANRSRKSDRLNVIQTGDAILNLVQDAGQTTPTPNEVVKSGFEQFGQTRVADDDVVDLYNRVMWARR